MTSVENKSYRSYEPTTEPRRRRKTAVVAQLRQTLVNSVPDLPLEETLLGYGSSRAYSDLLGVNILHLTHKVAAAMWPLAICLFLLL